MIDLYLLIFTSVFLYMTAWYIVAIILRRNDVADIAWWLGFLLVVTESFFYSGISLVGIVVTVLVAVWSVRISTHIYVRNQNKSEDYRYKQWRDAWWKWFYIRTFFQIFILQGILLIFISFPAVIAISFSENISLLYLIFPVIVWVSGFFIEIVSDYQLSVFKKNPLNKGKLMRTWLWRYSRHPNYFGEVLLWWGIWLFSYFTPYFWIALIGPLTITFLIVFVSGIPLLEKKMQKHPDFPDYKKHTSVFFPWFSRHR